MTRILKHHRVSGGKDELQVHVIDQRGIGNANHEYIIAAEIDGQEPLHMLAHLKFQNGGIAVTGVNGITHETLLAVLIDRLEGFQAGPFASSWNDEALVNLRTALNALQSRTLARIARGVEGLQTP